MARWLSLFLLIGLVPTVLVHGWAERMGPDVSLAVEVHETTTEAEDVTLGAVVLRAESGHSLRTVATTSRPSQARRPPDLRPPR